LCFLFSFLFFFDNKFNILLFSQISFSLAIRDVTGERYN